MFVEKIFTDALSLPPTAATYQLSRTLAGLHPQKALVEGDSCLFDIEEYARAGQCSLEPKQGLHNQFLSHWEAEQNELHTEIQNGWYWVNWQGFGLEVVILNMGDDFHYWIMAEVKEIAETLLVAVIQWNLEVRAEVLVYDGNTWQKDEELFSAIKKSTFDNLVLPTALKQAIRDEQIQFFASREIFQEYNIPWQRGILFVGPPGNGKTHAVKALINELSKPCLYVKSLKARYGGDEGSIRRIFERARKTAPCVIVLEDLDAHMTQHNRSFFLNELDGFENNNGILVIGTTNYPGKLDAAIIDRPSRFDRKYHFELPGQAERLGYIQQWNQNLKPALKLSDEAQMQLANLTEDFSFAYLKELFVSATLRWMNQFQAQPIAQVLEVQVAMLRSEMKSTGDSKEKVHGKAKERKEAERIIAGAKPKH